MNEGMKELGKKKGVYDVMVMNTDPTWSNSCCISAWLKSRSI